MWICEVNALIFSLIIGTLLFAIIFYRAFSVYDLQKTEAKNSRSTGGQTLRGAKVQQNSDTGHAATCIFA